MDRDLVLLFATRTIRMTAYGGLAVVLALYLGAVGLDPGSIGLLLTATLAGDAVVSLLLTVRADRDGRRRTLMIGAALMILGGVVFAATDQFIVLIAAAVVAVLSPSGNEVGPFLSVEQAALSEIVPHDRRTTIFAWYQLVGSLATAAGSLLAGVVAQLLLDSGTAPAVAYRTVIIAYALAGIGIGLLASRVSPRVESPKPADPSLARRFGLYRSQRVVAKLASLFALDAFGGGFVIQTIVALWFTTRWGLQPGALGAVFFGANALAGFSGLIAARLAARFGLIATMVGTHIPSNVLLILVPFMPTVELAVGILLVRFSISQMDVPTRQSYTISVVQPDERSAAAGLTGVARSAGAAVSPLIAAPLVASSVLSGGLPFVISGVLKIAYDLLLWREFRSVRPPEETG